MNPFSNAYGWLMTDTDIMFAFIITYMLIPHKIGGEKCIEGRVNLLEIYWWKNHGIHHIVIVVLHIKLAELMRSL